MGPWISSFGSVALLCMETNSPNDFDTARGQEALAALNWLTTKSPIKREVDPNRLAMMGPLNGRRHGLRHRTPAHAASRDRAGTLVPLTELLHREGADTRAGRIERPDRDPTALASLYTTMPAFAPSVFAHIAGANHEFYRTANNVMMKLVIP